MNSFKRMSNYLIINPFKLKETLNKLTKEIQVNNPDYICIKMTLFIF